MTRNNPRERRSTTEHREPYRRKRARIGGTVVGFYGRVSPSADIVVWETGDLEPQDRYLVIDE